MGKKIMLCNEAPEIEIQKSEGDSVLLRFDIACLANIQAFDEGIAGFLKMPISEMTAKVVFAAAKDHNKDFTEEDAKKIVACLSLKDAMDIINEFTGSIGADSSNMSEEDTKKLLAQLLKK